MKISKQSRRDAKTLFNVCLVEGVLDENRVRQAVSLVIEKKPRSFMGTLHQFKRLVKLDLDRRTALVENAVETTPAQMEAIKANLSKQYGAGLNVGFAVNPGLIGGLRIKVGSDVYDGSVAGRFDALKSGN